MPKFISPVTEAELKIFRDRFDHIVNLPDDIADQYHKDVSLAALMQDMEQVFKIPMMRNEEYEKEHPELMQLYRTVSEARSL